MVDSEKLPLTFYQQGSVTDIAKDLLGKYLWTRINDEPVAGMIVETEAYSYLEKACHAHLNRRTTRTEMLFASGGVAYIYLCYGIHHLFNVVTNREETAEAVLIRGVEPVFGLDIMKKRRGSNVSENQLTSGPGKLSQAMGITTDLNGTSLTEDEIWISPGKTIRKRDIIHDVRIGVDYAGEDAKLPWRFLIRDNPYVSILPKS